MTPREQIIAKCQEVFATATRLYSVDLTAVGIHFDLVGRAAGYACRRGTRYYMRFNNDMMKREAFDHVLNNTVPHEIAHIVCMMNPSLGRSHNSGWARVCAQLGGNAERCHKEDVVYGKGTTYEYTSSTGHTHRFSQVIHRKIQAGLATYTLKGGKGRIDRTSAHSVVGHQGRTLAEPIVKKAATVTAPVQAVIPTAPVRLPTFHIGAPVAPVVAKPATSFAGASKASIARAIMLAGHTRGMSYEDVITAIMAATGHERQLARATYKANAPKVGIPVQ